LSTSENSAGVKHMVGVKMMVLLEAVRHAAPPQSKRHRFWFYKKIGTAI
jgi:hypothetical protein